MQTLWLSSKPRAGQAEPHAHNGHVTCIEYLAWFFFPVGTFVISLFSSMVCAFDLLLVLHLDLLMPIIGTAHLAVENRNELFLNDKNNFGIGFSVITTFSFSSYLVFLTCGDRSQTVLRDSIVSCEIGANTINRQHAWNQNFYSSRNAGRSS